MRAPNRKSFKDAITEFLQQHPEYGEWQIAFVLQLRDDPDRRIDEVWNKLINKESELDDDNGRHRFIRMLVLIWTIIELARYEAADNGLRRPMGVLEARLKKYYAKRLLSASSPHEYLSLLQELQDLARSSVFEKDKNMSDFFPELDIRSDHKGTRLRTAFMRLVSNLMHRLTKEWCDGEVATLTDVAFPQDEAITTNMVRSARRPQRSTSFDE